MTRNVLCWRSSQIKISAALEIDFINQSSDWRADSHLRNDVKSDLHYVNQNIFFSNTFSLPP